MKISDCRLGFIGFGHMAQILFQAMENARLLPRSQVQFHQRDPDRAKKNEMLYGITATSLKNLVTHSDLLILAVRPHQAKEVLTKVEEYDPSKMLITVLAGLKLDYYQHLWKGQLCRALPNLAAGVAEGMTTLVFPKGVTLAFQELVKRLFGSMGKVLEIREELMDIACAIAGSGPGFVFRLIESVAQMGEAQGLSPDQSLLLTAQTFLGAAKMVVKGHSPQKLLARIATPQGVTEVGLKKMKELKLIEALAEVFLAAMVRSKELSLDP
ncbi:MAG: pyrroline-5-carboxylate reductase [Chlamydiae bacterium RIFCSPHIGHO2_12_FULL_44_59]|nr:MAG: pyrroline-5-carboxylate reductase [Chlamydiae bacterium RIFCSPHIGHO2_01_FULL_44_39]OGN59557.1 MAG: pyrroline-5-carboxylate reductase [Chlamydiae bacterium RIFCSPHIGHO2_12_FULL_44_59]OGN67303.1 MAG: pyrroline-5-carboxylate reductase [Chlamydiae bacterium RIFCSPLOWO2_01_FULL_44_52]OGN68723.1 MAG: pyrroline-5-carboxylate reductase [Chlamydiae bacterium RIFCSPLOWO2_02_FULL_45_22]OGN69245.1 MAG: pyrroline-5-carboxylate reductase [Chlamydiae bacterium RIFCSPLOWO2_12_FULL_45_20]